METWWPSRLTPCASQNDTLQDQFLVHWYDLLATRELTIQTMIGEMEEHHRRFLISLEAGEPDWSLFSIPAISKLPAVRWRLHNLSLLGASRRRGLAEVLASALKGM